MKGYVNESFDLTIHEDLSRSLEVSLKEKVRNKIEKKTIQSSKGLDIYNNIL